MTRNFEKISQEGQLGQGYLHKDESFSDVPIPPLRCTHKLMEINYDERRVGPLKECKNIVGKITTDSLHKSDMRHVGEDPSLSIYQEGCVGNKDQYASHDETFHVVLPNKKPNKKLRKLQPIVISDQQGLIPIVNGHEKQKIAPLWDSNTAARTSTSNNLGI